MNKVKNSIHYDLVVIGAGSGGVRAARMAANLGIQVAVIEKSALGGTCVNLGCIPKKLYSYAASYASLFEESKGYGWSIEGKVTLDWQRLKERRASEISRLNGVYQNLLKNSGVAIYHGAAKLINDHQVAVSGDENVVLEADKILIATGGWPTVPEIPGKEYVITSNEIFDLEAFPKRLVIVGAGYIACEFASIFNEMGAEVHLLYRGNQILRGFDDDVRDFVAKQLSQAGVKIHLNTDVDAVQKEGNELIVHLKEGGVLTTDQVLYATGRHPNTKGLGLELSRVTLGAKGEIIIDDYFQTSSPSISALGDVTNRVQLTPVAIAEAMIWVDNHYGQKHHRTMNYEYIPTAVFTHPNIGTVGLTEAQAKERYPEIEVYKSEFRPLKHTLSGSHARMLMKLIVDKASQRVVGLHVVGEEAGEITQGFAVAIKAGLTKADFDATVGIHPTAAEELVTMRTPV